MDGAAVIRLRGHHLICLHFFRGEGYNEEFKAALRALLEAAEEGRPVEVSAGVDDVCLRCPYLKGDECRSEHGAEEEIRRMDALAVRLLGTKPGARLSWHGIRERLPGIFGQWARACCPDCSWRQACIANPLWRRLQRA